MRRVGVGRRKPSPPRSRVSQSQSTALRPFAVLLLLLVVALLVLSTLPQTSDYAEKTLHFEKQQLNLPRERVTQGIVVSHGFLKIVVDVAYTAHKQQETPPSLVIDRPETKVKNDHAGGTEKPQLNQTTVKPSKPGRIETSNSSQLPTTITYSPTLTGSVPSPPKDPPPPIHFHPLNIKSRSKDEIIVDVVLHRIRAPDDKSLLTCRMSEADLRIALKESARIWRSQAKIVLRYSDESVTWDNVSVETQHAYEEHLERYPRNDETGQPWTTDNPGRIGLVANDLIQMLSSASLDPWSKTNPVHVYCIGAFVGYNGVTWTREVFIRSIKYHQTDNEMDVHTFTRILAHEIGHVLNLRHPSNEACSAPCDEHTCNLMCQQRALPRSSGLDPRFARALTTTQISRARTSAAMLDIFNSAHFLSTSKANKFTIGTPTEVLPNTKPLSSPMVFLSKPVSTGNNTLVSRISLAFAKLKPVQCTLALVAGRLTDASMSVRVKAVGQIQSSAPAAASTKSGVSKLIVRNVDASWWTNSRHIEIEVQPAVKIPPGDYVGVYFGGSCSSAVQLRKGSFNELLSAPKVTSSLLTSSKQFTEVRVERTSGVSAIFNVLIEYSQ